MPYLAACRAATAAQIALHGLTVMDAGIVTDDMDFPIPQQVATQVIEMTDEQNRGARFEVSHHH
jgi:hypothetical protein